MARTASSPLAECREAAGYTQERLAELLSVGRVTVGRWERGVQSPQASQRGDLAGRLGITLEILDEVLVQTVRLAQRTTRTAGTAVSLAPAPRRSAPVPSIAQRRDQPAPVAPEAADEFVRAAIPRLRQALDRIDLPEDGPVRPYQDLRVAVAELSEHRVQARYGPLGQALPPLISELARAVSAASGADSERASALLTLALRAADGMTYKYGYLDLSARIIDMMRRWSAGAASTLVRAMTAYVGTETFFATGDLGTASKLLTAAADELPVDVAGPAARAASYGALHMRAAVVAARLRKADLAHDHLAEAWRAARRCREGVYLGTAFGPASVRIHELAVAVDLGDNPAAVQRASIWHPPANLPAERRSHYYIDLGRAELGLGHYQSASHSIFLARKIAPEHVREHPQVKNTLASLLQTKVGGDDRLRDLAAWLALSTGQVDASSSGSSASELTTQSA